MFRVYTVKRNSEGKCGKRERIGDYPVMDIENGNKYTRYNFYDYDGEAFRTFKTYSKLEFPKFVVEYDGAVRVTFPLWSD